MDSHTDTCRHFSLLIDTSSMNYGQDTHSKCARLCFHLKVQGNTWILCELTNTLLPYSPQKEKILFSKVIKNKHIEKAAENQIPLPVLLPELRGPNAVTFPTIK